MGFMNAGFGARLAVVFLAVDFDADVLAPFDADFAPEPDFAALFAAAPRAGAFFAAADLPALLAGAFFAADFFAPAADFLAVAICSPGK